MTTSVSPYQINFKGHGFTSISGFLVEQNGGYACLQTWPQLGQCEARSILHQLNSQSPDHPTVQQTISSLNIDREFRKNGQNAMADVVVPKSHRLLLNQSELLDVKENELVKVKFLPGREQVDQCQGQLRIDLNQRGQVDELLNWWEALSPSAQKKIQLVEDPTPYDRDSYQRLSQKFPIAIDWTFNQWVESPWPVSFLVLKPAHQNCEVLLQDYSSYFDRFYVTSNLDHPIGLQYARLVAARLAKKWQNKMDICGLEKIDSDYSHLFETVTNDSVGFGFSQHFESCRWEILN